MIVAIGNAEPAAEIDEGDIEALAAQIGDQFVQQRERIAERREVGDLAADMHMHAGDLDAGQRARQRVEGRGLRERHAEFVLGLSRRDLVVGVGVDIGVDAEGDARGRAPAAATSLSALSSGSDSTLKAKMPASSATAISACVLPTPENTICSGAILTASARRSSPSDTMSMPAPSRPSVASTPRFEFALTE